MKWIIDVFLFPEFIMGIIIFIGTSLLGRMWSERIESTVQTILGFMVLQIGSMVVINSLTPFSEMFDKAFGLTGLMLEDNAVSQFVQITLGKETALILVIGFAMNMLLARITRFKYIYLTGNMLFTSAAIFALTLKQLGLSLGWIVLVGGVIQGVYSIIFPAISYRSVQAVTKEKEPLGMAFPGSSLIAFSSAIGGRIGKNSADAEEIPFPNRLAFLKNRSVTMALVMSLIFTVTSFFVEKSEMLEISQHIHPVIFSIATALEFTAGVTLILYGVKLFVQELVPAFKGISERLVPGAKASVGVPIFMPYGENSLLIGFIVAFIVSVLTLLVTKSLGIVILPSVSALFFVGGVAGIFGNRRGGWIGAVVSAGITSLCLSITGILAYKILELSHLDLTGLTLGYPDIVLVVILIKIVGKWIGL
ncbi:hypothetical protein PML95_02945 [Vagococcus lutrae]|uniref:Ascorbate-specific PTS system EIIC component n=1 Tax=Vagococcus lutrae TaxID=81947 RepID=A0AAE9XN58_9ENTE|nr:PTS transporter subunit IIC [Vagococcus lutrae]MDO5741664.1 PTS transporter subunit IIC [Vagococcus sp.]RST90903.1 hypothetical protein CBF33_08735 [Vagococcus lutrae]WCG23213.1 hypothetical protein PML95_02945 [Vagococcus lutrae]